MKTDLLHKDNVKNATQYLEDLLTSPKYREYLKKTWEASLADPEGSDLLVCYHEAGHAIYYYTHGGSLLFVTIELLNDGPIKDGKAMAVWSGECLTAMEMAEGAWAGPSAEALAPERCQPMRNDITFGDGLATLKEAIEDMLPNENSNMGPFLAEIINRSTDEWVAQPHISAMIHALAQALMDAKTLDGVQATQVLLDAFRQWKTVNICQEMSIEIEHPPIKYWHADIREKMLENGLIPSSAIQ